MSFKLSNTGTDLSGLAKELDISPVLLYRWRKEFPANEAIVFLEMGRSYSAQQELALLKKELRETQMERDILKKAISIFSKGDNKYSGS